MVFVFPSGRPAPFRRPPHCFSLVFFFGIRLDYSNTFFKVNNGTQSTAVQVKRFAAELGRTGFGRRFDRPKLLGVRLLHQAFVVALNDVRAVASPRSGFALVLETRQMI